MTPDELAATIGRVQAWLAHDELRHSRLIWRLEADSRLDPPWPYEAVHHDPAGAVLVDLRRHPRLGGVDPPWFQVDATDAAALELLAAVWLPPSCEVLCPHELLPCLAPLGTLATSGQLDVYACAPGELGEAALPYEPVRLTSRHRALVEDDHWRSDDLAAEQDEDREGVRWGLLRDDKLVAGLLVQRVSRQLVEVADVHTRPEYRRRGLGAALVQHVVRRLHERGLTATYSVHPTNEPSIALARAVGFRPALAWSRVRLTRA